MGDWDLSESLWALVAAYIVVRVVDALLGCNPKVCQSKGSIRSVSILAGIAAAGLRFYRESRFLLEESPVGGSLTDRLPAVFDSLAFGAVVGVAAYPLAAIAGLVWAYLVRPILNAILEILRLPVAAARSVATTKRRRGALRADKERREADEARREVEGRRSLDQRARELVAQRRRDQARLDCELEYFRCYPLIQNRFRRRVFDAVLSRYMNDGFDAQEVESRSLQLLALIRSHEEQVHQRATVASIDQLASWYVAEKTKIEALDLDGFLKDCHLRELNERYSDLTAELMRTAKP